LAKKTTSKKVVPGTDETIAIPAVSKGTAGAATGAVVGAVAGPMGAVIGGVVGAVLGKRAESGKPVMPAVKRTARQVVSGAQAAAKTARSTVRAVKKTKLFGGKRRAKKTSTVPKATARRAKKKTASTKTAKKSAKKSRAAATSRKGAAKKTAKSASRKRGTAKKIVALGKLGPNSHRPEDVAARRDSTVAKRSDRASRTPRRPAIRSAAQIRQRAEGACFGAELLTSVASRQ
jgi:hypothetical protein